MCQPTVLGQDLRVAKHSGLKRPKSVKNHVVLPHSGTVVSTVGVIFLTVTLRQISEIGGSLFGNSYLGGLHFEISLDLKEIRFYFIVTSAVLIALVLKFFGCYLFDETRHAKNHPHEHVYARIRGVWYDFAEFDHPGGPIALNLTKDRDATALFESHHLLVPHHKLTSTLSKYRVDDEIAKHISTLDPRDDGAHYIWEGFENDEFVRDAKKLLISYFLPIAKRRGITLYQATKATPERWMWLALLTTLFVSSLIPFVAGKYWTLLVTPQLAWVLIANYWHDGLHLASAPIGV